MLSCLKNNESLNLEVTLTLPNVFEISLDLRSYRKPAKWQMATDADVRNWKHLLNRCRFPFPKSYWLEQCSASPAWHLLQGQWPQAKSTSLETLQSMEALWFPLLLVLWPLFCCSSRRYVFNINSPSGWRRDTGTSFECVLKFVTMLSFLQLAPRAVWCCTGQWPTLCSVPGQSRHWFWILLSSQEQGRGYFQFSSCSCQIAEYQHFLGAQPLIQECLIHWRECSKPREGCHVCVFHADEVEFFPRLECPCTLVWFLPGAWCCSVEPHWGWIWWRTTSLRCVPCSIPWDGLPGVSSSSEHIKRAALLAEAVMAFHGSQQPFMRDT